MENTAELQRQYDELIKSYKSIQLEYVNVKQELETLRGSKCMHEVVSAAIRSNRCSLREGEEYCIKTFEYIGIYRTLNRVSVDFLI